MLAYAVKIIIVEFKGKFVYFLILKIKLFLFHSNKAV